MARIRCRTTARPATHFGALRFSLSSLLFYYFFFSSLLDNDYRSPRFTQTDRFEPFKVRKMSTMMMVIRRAPGSDSHERRRNPCGLSIFFFSLTLFLEWDTLPRSRG